MDDQEQTFAIGDIVVDGRSGYERCVVTRLPDEFPHVFFTTFKYSPLLEQPYFQDWARPQNLRRIYAAQEVRDAVGEEGFEMLSGQHSRSEWQAFAEAHPRTWRTIERLLTPRKEPS